jgi:hypothetical protein
MSDAVEVRQFALGELDQRYAALRLQATGEDRQAMTRSLSHYGQTSPLVVWPAVSLYRRQLNENYERHINH